MRSTRWRTAACVFLIPAVLLIYAIGVVNVATYLPAHWAVDLCFYTVAGLLWIPLVLRMIGWAARDPGGM
jgi:hypothetical protein